MAEVRPVVRAGRRARRHTARRDRRAPRRRFARRRRAASRPALAALIPLALVLGPGLSTLGAARSAPWRSRPYVVAAADPAVRGVARAGGGPALPRVVRQTRPTTCGPAALATLLSWLGRDVSEDDVARRAEIGASGVTLAEFARLARLYGVAGAWYAAPGRGLDALPVPFVAHLRSGGGHFVVVRAVLGGVVVLADPARGLVAQPRGRFARAWSGRAYVLDGAALSPAPPGATPSNAGPA